jgi:hypothetical protein
VEALDAAWAATWTLPDALRSAVAALAGPDRTLVADDLEVAVLAQGNGRRAFRRLVDTELTELLA